MKSLNPNSSESLACWISTNYSGTAAVIAAIAIAAKPLIKPALETITKKAMSMYMEGLAEVTPTAQDGGETNEVQCEN